MKPRNVIHDRRETEYIQLNTGKCKACWKCIESCTQNVLGKIDIWIHRHAKIINPYNCTGCLKCTGVCEFNAIKKRKINNN